jgi:hypothetical protein
MTGGNGLQIPALTSQSATFYSVFIFLKKKKEQEVIVSRGNLWGDL